MTKAKSTEDLQKKFTDLEASIKEEDPTMWKPLPYEPYYVDYHPCIHRWFRKYQEPRPPRKANYKYREISERNCWLAQPMVRRLLWLWILHANTLSPERRARLKTILMSYGYTEEELNNYLRDAEGFLKQQVEETKIEKGESGEADKKEKSGEERKTGESGKGRKKGKSGKGRKKGKSGKRRKKGKSSDKIGKDEEGGDARSKVGKGWPHATATVLFQVLWTTLTQPPDEAYLSRAREYFDVQASILLEICAKALGKDIPSPSSACPLDQTLAIGCLNVVVYLAKNITAPAQAIPDSEVETLLALNGDLQKPIEKIVQDKKGSKGKDKKGKKRKKVVEEEIPEVIEEKPQEDFVSDWVEKTYPFDASCLLRKEPNEDPVDFFNRTLVWYSPRIPEFICNGRRKFPADIEIINAERETLWTIKSMHVIEPDKLIPDPVPLYFEIMRPSAYAYNEEGDEMSPWYIMSDEYFYKPGPKISDLTAIIEQVELFLHMLTHMISIEDLTMQGLIEMLMEIATSAKCFKENISKEDKLIDDKRTIIIQRIFIGIFGVSFRDFSEETLDIMLTLCRRFAVIIRQLYRHTAYTLWNLQHRDMARMKRGSSKKILPDDPQMLEAWNEWLAWLLKICTSGQAWTQWLIKTEEDLVEIATNRKPKAFVKWLDASKSEAEDWFVLNDDEQEASIYYSERVFTMEQVRDRAVSVSSFNELYPAAVNSRSSGLYDWAQI